MISKNPIAFAKCSTLDSLMISLLLPWYDVTCSQHQALPPNHCSMSRTTAGLYYHSIEPTHPHFLQATGLLASVCANSNNQVHLPVYLLSLFTWLINTQTSLPCLIAAVCSRLPITRVSRALLQHSHSASCCVIQSLLWLRRSNAADCRVQSVNPVPWGPLQDLHCHCNSHLEMVPHPVPWRPLQDLHCHCNIHKCSARHVVFILSLCLGVFLSPNFYSLYPTWTGS
jgi:hypothetical protein